MNGGLRLPGSAGAGFGRGLVAALALMAWFVRLAGADPGSACLPRPLVIRGVSLFDPRTMSMLVDRTIVCEGGRIAAVHERGRPVRRPRGSRELDGRGLYVIPGLIDAHVHLVHVLNQARISGDEVLPLYLAAGVTAVRSTGDEIVAAAGVARFADANPGRCPRVFLCGPLIDRDPPIHPGGVGRAVTDPGKVGAFVDEMADWKVRTLKIYAGAPREVGRAVIEEGHRRGMVVTAHLGAYRAQDAVADGIDCLEHIWSVFNYIIPAEAAARADHRATLDVGNPLSTALIGAIARGGVMVDPTLCVFRNMLLLQDQDEVRNHADNGTVPERLREFWPRYTPVPRAPLAERRSEFGKYQELTGRLHRAGVTLLAGTDSPEPNVPPGLSLHQELEYLVQSGLTPAEALRTATWNNARALREEGAMGTVAAGYQADLVILDADPTKDIRNTRRIRHVVRGGRVADPAELRGWVPRR